MTLAEEYVGATIEVMQSKNKSLQGLSGKILDETKYTFIIQTNNKQKRILKQGNLFRINGKTVNGDKIAKRPEERIKL